jgi:uncharacterized protein YciI
MKKLILLAMVFLSVLNSNAQKSDTTRSEFLGVLTLTEKYRDEKNWTAADQSVVGEHFRRLKKFSGEGKVVLAGKTSYDTDHPDMMGLVIFYAKDEAEAQQFMKDDPAVKNGIMNMKVHPYGVAIKKCD